MKWTVRVRLTVLYGGLFIATTTALLLTVNLLLQALLNREVAMVKYGVGDPGNKGGGIDPKAKSDILEAKRSFEVDEVKRDIQARAAKDLQRAVLDYQWGVTWIAVAVLAVIGLAACWWLAGRVLRPLHKITATAQRLSLSTLDERIALAGPSDEFKELADTFDAMLKRLERAVDSQRRFVANASHELRTPLAIQRAVIEIGLEDPTPNQFVRMKEELLRANLRTEKLDRKSVV